MRQLNDCLAAKTAKNVIKIILVIIWKYKDSHVYTMHNAALIIPSQWYARHLFGWDVRIRGALVSECESTVLYWLHNESWSELGDV